MKKGILFLTFSILCEAVGTTMLKLSDGFSVLGPSIGVIVSFLAAFTSLSFALKTIPLSSAYATWSGAGTALTAFIGVWLFQESLSFLKVLALLLVIIGIVMLNKSKDTESVKAQSA